ncbi:MAG: beta-lactamase family protein, partial [Planctomycetes bacterium]|nr:beta-lactamase family protein [Planctomycetota bacterium]
MRISVPLGLLLISAAAPTAALAQRSPAAPPPAPPALAPISDAMDDIVHALRLDGAALAVVRTDGTIHQSEHGRLAGAQVLPIASASKWLAVATILTLVDDGVLDLDVPVARYLQEFDRDDKDDLTLRQCLSCTAGFQARIGGRMRGWGSGEFAAAAADTALRLQPGEGFHYGGVTFQVAAVAAERVTGKSWHELFAARIAEPLGLEQTRFGGLYPIAGEPGTHPLPWVAGGAVSSLNDYTKFVRCLVDRGRCGDRQVLSEASVAAMFRDSVPRNVAVQAPGIDVDDVRYGLGTWIFPIAGESGAVR